MRPFQNFGVIGAGAWGTALAQTLARAGRNVTVWAFEEDCAQTINDEHENKRYLSGVKLDPRVKATSDLKILGDLDAVLSVVPAQHTRNILEQFVPHMRENMPIILCSKGIEISTKKFMSDVLAEVAPKAMPAVLSGPSFAIDVANGLPTAVTLACEDDAVGTALVEKIAAPTFRPYLANDVLGAEIGGAVKNVLAIACGIVLGKGLGRSAHAAIIARGFAEMTRLGKALGCQPETLTGLCGLGDLVLTCSSEQSRNMSCGLALGQGQSLADIMASRNSVTEGVATAPALKDIAEDMGVDMPICSMMADILVDKVDVDTAIMSLLSRQHKKET